MKIEKDHVELLRHFSHPRPAQLAPSPGCLDLQKVGYLTIERAPRYGFTIATTEAGRKALETVGDG